jgi:hypothetical protein
MGLGTKVLKATGVVALWWGMGKVGDMTGHHPIDTTLKVGWEAAKFGVKAIGVLRHPLDSHAEATKEWGLDSTPQLLYRIEDAAGHPEKYNTTNDPNLVKLGLGRGLGRKMTEKELDTLQDYRDFPTHLNTRLKELHINPADVLSMPADVAGRPDPGTVRLVDIPELRQVKDTNGNPMVDDQKKPVMEQTGVQVIYLTGADIAVQKAEGVEIKWAGSSTPHLYPSGMTRAKGAPEIGAQVGTIIGEKTASGGLAVTPNGAEKITSLSLDKRRDNPRRLDSPYYTVDRQELIDFLAGKHGKVFTLEFKHRVEKPSGNSRENGHIQPNEARKLKLTSRNADSRLLQDAAQVNAPQQELRASNNETRRQTNAAANLRVKNQSQRNHGRAA